MPQVSIIVPIYNSEKFLDRCVSSLVNQTLKDIEIILVSDASPDNSREIMERYAREDSRVVTIYNEENGHPNPRNAGILVSKADYVGFVDADDWVELDMYEKLYSKTQDGRIDVVISDLRNVDENNKVLREEIIYTSDMFDGENIKQKIIDNMTVNGGRLFTNIWKKSLIVKNGFFFLEKNNYNDAITCLWYLKADSFAKVDKIMYNYYKNTASITNTLNNRKIITDRPVAHVDRMNRAKECGLYNEYKDVLDYRFYYGYLLHSCLILAVRYTYPQYKEIIELKKGFKTYVPEGIQNNPYYKNHKKTHYDRQFALIQFNTYIGATILWLARKFKYILK